MKPRLLLAALGIFATLVLAYALNGLVIRYFLPTLAGLARAAQWIYRAVPQSLLWAALIGILLGLALGALRPTWPGSRARARLARQPGPVEELARIMEMPAEGVYFRWKLAREIATILKSLQETRSSDSSPGLVFDEDVPPQVRRYLEAGLNTSFGDYPLSRIQSLARRAGLPAPQTPFDIDLGPVVDYIEKEMEKDHDYRD